MVYDRLNSAVDSLALGNGTVYNFIDYVGRMHLTGGIGRYTLNRGYFFNNISFNREGGLSGRYGYGTGYADNSEAQEAIEGSIGKYVDGDFINNSTLAQDRVGDFYTVRGPLGNADIPFTTIKDFTNLNRTIRNEDNLIYNVGMYTFEDRYATDGNDAKFQPNLKYPIIPQTIRGDENVETKIKPGYYFSTLFGDRRQLNEDFLTFNQRNLLKSYTEYITDEQGVTESEKNQYKDLETLVEGNIRRNDDFTTMSAPKKTRLSLVPFGQAEIDKKYRRLRVTNKTLRLNPSVSEVFDKFSEFYDKRDGEEQIKLSNTGNLGVFNFYEGSRSQHDGRNLFWFGRSYGVSTNEAPEAYSVNTKNNAPSKITVDSSFKAGSFRTNAGVNSANFSYYQENDKGSPVYGFKKNNTSQEFSPSIDTFNNSSRLMKKMNDKFRSNEIKSLINRFHTSVSPEEVSANDPLISAYDAKYGLSRGRNLLKANHENDDETGFNNPYCRVWTAHYQYSKLKDRIRPFMQNETFMSIKELQSNLGKLRPEGGAQKLNDNSVLMDSGFVKITPFNKDGVIAGGRDSLKKYMFSIENLAWKGFTSEDRLSDEQIGPFGGRIMWFPPYNLKFTENVSVDWAQHEFIGRGEKIYTYKNTDRSGTLDFTILVDHPSILNKAVGTGESSVTDEDILRFFAGCGTLEPADNEDDYNSGNSKYNAESENPDTTPKRKPDSQFIEINYIMFYPNNFSAKQYYSDLDEVVEKIDSYEMDNDARAFVEMDQEWADQKLAMMNYDNMSKYDLNAGNWSEAVKERIELLLPIDNIDDYHPYSEFKNLAYYYSQLTSDGRTSLFGYPTDDYEIDSIEVCGFASDHGYEEANRILAKNRATTMKNLAKYFCDGIDNDKITYGDCLIIPVEEEDGVDDVNDLDAKIGRSSIIKFKLKLREDIAPTVDNPNSQMRILPQNVVNYFEDEEEEKLVSPEEAKNEVVITSTFHGNEREGYNYTYQNEFMYFKMLEATDPLVFKKIKDKVKYFDPGFHSITPEGYNARLNFLHQCTRQGPTIGSHSGEENTDNSNMKKAAANMSFGMAPYCILRIGDFYYSKIVIDSMSINFDRDGGMSWDLNPEGVGVQTMMANVSLNFHFIGGQDLEGPVQQLQNALTYNYYANSSVYTPETQYPMPEIKNETKK